MKDFIEELKWRGMVNDVTPGTEDQLKKEMTTGYIGFDPSASSLHIGNLATIMLLKHFQLCGHKPIALVGGATGMIGDPSGKSNERNLLDEEVLLKNQEGIKKQLEKFLDFSDIPNAAEVVNNYDWFKSFSFLGFLRDAGKHITVNYMMAKDSVKKRLETGLSFTEFSYQLLQGYDYYWLYANKNVKLQMGGSDQWGNITTGTEFIRRKASGEAYALTTPLVTKADGSKFGKSEAGNVWLDADLTSPYQFYQFWLKCSDEDAHKLIRVFTLYSKEEIEALEVAHAEKPHERALQKAIAKDVTIRVHSYADFEMAVTASNILFGKSTTEELETLDEKTLLSVFDGVPQVTITHTDFNNAADIAELLSDITQRIIFTSKGEVKRMIKGGGLSINKQRIESADIKLEEKFLQNKYLLVQKGKTNYYLIKIEF